MTVPDEGSNPPERILSNVDLPEPLDPDIAKRLPDLISKVRF
jgi:hypothetical protein